MSDVIFLVFRAAMNKAISQSVSVFLGHDFVCPIRKKHTIHINIRGLVTKKLILIFDKMIIMLHV